MLTKTRIGNHLRRHALGDQPTFRQGFKEGVAFAQKHAAPVQAHTDHPARHYDRTCAACQDDEYRCGGPDCDGNCCQPVQQDEGKRIAELEAQNKQLLEALKEFVGAVEGVVAQGGVVTIDEYNSDWFGRASAAIAAAEKSNG